MGIALNLKRQSKKSVSIMHGSNYGKLRNMVLDVVKSNYTFSEIKHSNNSLQLFFNLKQYGFQV